MYTIVFNDGEVWLGGEPQNSQWNEMPKKPIKKIEYNLLGHTMIFEGYEAYNHIVERASFLLTKSNMPERISKIFVMAKKRNKIYTYLIDIFKNEIDTVCLEFGKEYYGKSTTGWKEGIQEENPTFKLL